MRCGTAQGFVRRMRRLSVNMMAKGVEKMAGAVAGKEELEREAVEAAAAAEEETARLRREAEVTKEMETRRIEAALRKKRAKAEEAEATARREAQRQMRDKELARQR
eukprot:SAG11_NODE_14205_length_621_cov_1.574713_2_plen_106_part_01